MLNAYRVHRLKDWLEMLAVSNKHLMSSVVITVAGQMQPGRYVMLSCIDYIFDVNLFLDIGLPQSRATPSW